MTPVMLRHDEPHESALGCTHRKNGISTLPQAAIAKTYKSPASFDQSMS
jgi:hypothetical protein